jgi:hypothetical protein
MRNRSSAFLLVSFVPLAGCGFLKKADADAGTDAGAAVAAVDAAVAAPVGATGKNAAAITHLPTEVATNDVLPTLQFSSPHTAPNGGGTKVIDLKSGSPVTRVARTNPNGWSLIVFQDPNVPTDTLMGWVSDVAFTVYVPHDAGVVPVVDAGIVGLRCPPGQDAVMVSANVAPSCRKVCASDKDCKHSCQAATNNMGKSIKACMSD